MQTWNIFLICRIVQCQPIYLFIYFSSGHQAERKCENQYIHIWCHYSIVTLLSSQHLLHNDNLWCHSYMCVAHSFDTASLTEVSSRDDLVWTVNSESIRPEREQLLQGIEHTLTHPTVSYHNGFRQPRIIAHLATLCTSCVICVQILSPLSRLSFFAEQFLLWRVYFLKVFVVPC